MRKKSVAPHQRLAEFFDATKQGASTRTGKLTVDSLRRMDPTTSWGESDLDWDNEIIRDAYAASVLTLSDAIADKPVAAAFVASGLNPKNPIHWRMLISLFSWAHFEDRRGRGRPPEWSDRRYCRLLQDVDRMQVKHPEFSMSSIFDNLGKKPAYKNKKGNQLSGGRLKTAYREACDPAHNRLLATWLLKEIQRLRADYHHEGRNWSSEIEAEWSKKITTIHCASIASRWRRAENPEVF
jgi:hypothetical protein